MLYITDARILDPSRAEDYEGDILVDRGKIIRIDRRWLKPNEAPSGAKVIHAHGAYLVPAFWDIHVHLREPGQTHKETLQTGAASAAAGGFGLVMAMPNTKPAIDNVALLQRLRQKAAALSRQAEIVFAGAVSVGQLGRKAAPMKAMFEAGAAAFSDDGFPIRTELLMRRALHVSHETGAVVIDHCEDLNLSAKGVIHDGSVSRRLGVKGISPESESSWVKRNIEILKTSPGRLHLAHISTKESLHLIRRAKDDGLSDRLTCEVCPHHFSLTDQVVLEQGANAKMNPPLRTMDDVAAIQEALADGVIDAIASDHAPHSRGEKKLGIEKAPFGVIGMESVLPVTITYLVRHGVISLRRVVELLTVGPAKILGRKISPIEPGQSADFVIFDPGQSFKLDCMQSKSRNSPFLGQTLHGRLLVTIRRGEVVWRTGQKSASALRD